MKRFSFGVDLAMTKLFAGCSNGELKVFDISQNIVERISTVKLNENGASLPFTLFSEFMDKAYVADFEGRVHSVDLKNNI